MRPLICEENHDHTFFAQSGPVRNSLRYLFSTHARREYGSTAIDDPVREAQKPIEDPPVEVEGEDPLRILAFCFLQTSADGPAELRNDKLAAFPPAPRQIARPMEVSIGESGEANKLFAGRVILHRAP